MAVWLRLPAQVRELKKCDGVLVRDDVAGIGVKT